MLELGGAEGTSHAEVLAAAWACADVVLTIGPRFAQAWQRAGGEAGVEKNGAAHGCAYPSLSAGVVEAIAGQLLGGDTVLLKGSRGMRLEGVLAGLATCAAEPSGERAR
jgi:UDP-N-acetylmuramyl pentapeptide synthase